MTGLISSFRLRNDIIVTSLFNRINSPFEDPSWNFTADLQDIFRVDLKADLHSLAIPINDYYLENRYVSTL